MNGQRLLGPALALTAALLGAPAARAETSIYVAEQPGLSLLLKAEGGEVYATYLRAEIICRGAGAHREESNEATHRAFQDGPVALRRSGGHLRLVIARNGPFESHREVIDGEMHPDRIVGTFSYYGSGEGLGGSCESDAPGFEPGSGEREPPVSFEARRYVPLGDPSGAAPGPAAEALYFTARKALEIYLWIGERAITRIRGTAALTCVGRGGKVSARRRALGFDPPYPLDGEDNGFDALAALDYGFRARSARLTGTVGRAVTAGRLRIVGANRDRGRITSRCRTGRPGSDGWVPFQATRYVPAAAPSAGQASR